MLRPEFAVFHWIEAHKNEQVAGLEGWRIPCQDECSRPGNGSRKIKFTESLEDVQAVKRSWKESPIVPKSTSYVFSCFIDMHSLGIAISQ